MFIKKILLLLLVLSGACVASFGQDADFCDAVNAITHDAPNKFRNIKGRMTGSNANATMWATGIKMPGSLACRFVASMGLFYEAAFLQTNKKSDVKAVYDKYKGMLKDCLGPQGYTMTLQNNFYQGMADYKKVVFMPDVKDDVKADAAPSHITMEATYNKEVGQYTVVVYIFEH